MKRALILIDIQQDYFPNGKMEVAGALEAAKKAGALLAYFREKDLPVFHIQHISTRPGATFFLPNTGGIDIHPAVAPLPVETVIKKHFPNSFRDTALGELLTSRGIRELVICGMMSHMCVDATVRTAFDKGYLCRVAHDACATRDLTFNGGVFPAREVHGAFMAALAPVYATVAGTEEIIASLRGETGDISQR